MKKAMITTLKFILFFLGWAFASALLPLPNTDNQAIWRLWAEITPLLAIIIFTAVFWLTERRTVNLNLFINPAKGLLVGSIAGVLWLAIAVGIMLIVGVIHFESVNPVSSLPVWIIAAFLNVIMQELLVRGYLYQMVKQKHNIVGAIILGGVSLADDYPHMLNTTFSGNMLLSGGVCKIEGSVIVLIWNTLLILYFLLRMKKSKAQP